MQSSYYIHGPLGDENIFAVLCHFAMGLTHCYKTTVFYGRPLSVSGRPCYILPMFFYIYFFMAALFSGPG